MNRYFVNADLFLLNGTVLQEKYNSDAIVHTEAFNGFLRLGFYKCMMMNYIGEGHRNVELAKFYYDKEKLQLEWQEDENSYLEMCIVVHYQNQFILSNGIEYGSTKFYSHEKKRVVVIDAFEILKRRNSRWRKCSTEVDNYDDMVVEEILRKRGCRPPYITGHRHYPKCDSKERIRDAKIEILLRRKMELPKACQRMSKKRNSVVTKNYMRVAIKARWHLSIYYPEDVKIITQSQDVDIHSLIGNIGGYLGLFLGNEYKLYNYYVFCNLKFDSFIFY